MNHAGDRYSKSWIIKLFLNCIFYDSKTTIIVLYSFRSKGYYVYIYYNAKYYLYFVSLAVPIGV